MKNRIKSRKYFSAHGTTVSKFQETSAMEQIRFIQINKKNVPRRDILQILVAIIPRFNVKRCPLSLKFCHLFICISVKQTSVYCKMTNNLCKSVKILISTIFYPVGMVSTNNQLKIYSEQIYKPLQQKPFHVMFLIKKRSADVQYLISNFMIRKTKAASHRCS